MSLERVFFDDGKIVSDWEGTPTGPFTLKVSIPANTSAKIFLPATPSAHVTQNGKPVEGKKEGDSYTLQVGSGSYTFVVK